MSTPRTKRQFAGAASDPAQRQITSFFGKSSDLPASASDVSGSSPATGSSISQPTLPAHVQSNLLSVGMRVRKSVPEGYKTGSSYGSFSLWTEADAGSGSLGKRPSNTAAVASGPRELAPFCGIHKIGGLAVQSDPSPGYNLPAASFRVASTTLPGEDDVPELTSSQESTISSDSLPEPAVTSLTSRLAPMPIHTAMGAVPATATNRKRFYNENDAGEVPGVHSEFRARDASWWDGEVSPRSLAPASWDNARVMAFPRRRGRKGAAVRLAADSPAQDLAELGQENAEVVMDEDDFEEAAFLDHRWGETMDVE